MLRLVVAPAMAACLWLAVSVIRRGDIAVHGAWMVRAHALVLDAGRQGFTQGIGEAVVGTGELRTELAKGAGWVVNLGLAEWAVRRSARRTDRAETRSGAGSGGSPGQRRALLASLTGATL